MPYTSPQSKTEEYQGLQGRTQAKVKIKTKKEKPTEMLNSGDLCPLRKTFADGEFGDGKNTDPAERVQERKWWLSVGGTK